METTLNEESVNDPRLEEATPEWYTAEESATKLRVHVTTVHEMCRQKELASIKAGRDWRISAQGLQEIAMNGVHRKPDIVAMEQMADLVTERILAGLGKALSQQYIDRSAL